MSSKIKVLIVDDSILMRQGIAAIFSNSSEIEVVGEAADGKQALDMVQRLNPDVVTLDVNMPVMDGLSTLKHMMVVNPRPVVMLSSLTSEGADITFDALRYGAVDFVTKPSKDDSNFDHDTDLILTKVKAAAEVEVNAVRYIRIPDNEQLQTLTSQQCHQVIIIGAAEGGYGSLLKIIPFLRNDMSSAFMVVLYAGREHIEAFARYLESISAVRVKAATHGESVKAGVCYVSSGEDYMTIHHENNKAVLNIQSAPFDFRKGSVDRAMFSAVETFGSNVLGIILSGQGSDGIEGLDEVIHSGGISIVQEPASCLYKEMSSLAIEQCNPEYVVTDAKLSAVVSSVAPGSGELMKFSENVSVDAMS